MSHFGAIDVRHGLTSAPTRGLWHQMLTSAPSSIGILTSAQCETCVEVNDLCRSWWNFSKFVPMFLCRSSFTRFLFKVNIKERSYWWMSSLFNSNRTCHLNYLVRIKVLFNSQMQNSSFQNKIIETSRLTTDSVAQRHIYPNYLTLPKRRHEM